MKTIGKILNYQEMPKAIQNLVDGLEDLQYVKRLSKKATVAREEVLYQFVFRQGSEIWARFYNAQGELKGRYPFIPVEDA
jgi:hypothetical protein